MILSLPYPPTGNTSTRHSRGGHYLSDDVLAYRAKVRALVAAQDATRGFLEPLTVLCEVYPPDNRKRDLDNAWKSIGDALTHAGVWLDDSQIQDLRLVRMGIRDGGHVAVHIEQIGKIGRAG